MKTLAENDVVARELYDRDAFVYDQIWDFDVIHGFGDDPLTTGQVNELQLIQCLTTYQKQTIVLQADAPLTKGKFILKFGKQYTRPISFKALADQDSFGPSIATSLLALRGVDAVTVTRTDPLPTRTEWSATFPTTNTKHNALVPGWRTVEVQQFICAADSGVFAITFGNETIRNIPYNADSNTFVAFLSKLSFYGTFVTMTFSTLWHRALLADLPPMTFSTLDLKEEQQFFCGATGGNFAFTFEDGTKITGLPYSITADTLKATIQSKVSYIVDIDVTFADGQTTFCSDLGTTTTIRFVVVKATSGDGDLAEILADQTNNGGTDGLVHIANRLQFATMACGGSDIECNGNGQCLTLYDLAPITRANGVTQSFTYGEDPNDVSTWDAHRIRTCLCDPFYFGYDCLLKECPRGDDFNTDDDAIERQLIQCIADAGSFTLTFRDETTTNIPYNAVESDVKVALEELSTIGEVDVTFSGGAVACSSSLNIVVMVDFLTELGDLPPLSGSNTLLQDRINGDARDGSGSLVFVTGGDTLLGQTSVKGTREDAFCSNHGICDFSTGICTCHANYGGSDGKGGPGTIANCGFHELKYAVGTG
ncbi:hypothetical protein JG688_00000758 [Phytophthora aleatoria]|uniref:EGF-like domain-containing protein n=1 Tax=Phytophthora aleatoria TaxID=2496075 RepID=A0A8J5MDQ2_9STRA|nr:hypothetical protein JG688_00000758 [Phytophthora aleatoria]